MGKPRAKEQQRYANRNNDHEKGYGS